MKKLRKALLGTAVLLGLGFCAFVNLVNAPDKGARDTHNRESADKVVAALSAYHAQNARYPDALTDLVPAFVDPLPEVEGGGGARPFSYEVRADGGAFTMLYPEAPLGMLPADAFFVYDSERGAWQLETR